MLFWQILIDGFAISSLYALGATGFTLIFGVTGVLNLSHGAIMVAAAVAAWWIAGSMGASSYVGALFGVMVAISGCLRGIQCERSASAVGYAATSAVVTGIVCIVVATAIITFSCQVLGI